MSIRLTCLLLASLSLGFAAYGSLVPLDLQRVPIEEALRRFSQMSLTPWRMASKTDFVSNVLLFLPAGFFLTGAIAAYRRGLAVATIPLTGAIALAASLAIEFSQIFARRRTPSFNDVVAETLGAVLGAMAWAVFGPAVSRWAARTLSPRSPVDGLRNVLLGYAAVWAVLGLMPLDFTLRPAELAEKYRAGRIALVPFGQVKGVMDLVITVAGDALRAAPIGALMALSLPVARGVSGLLVATLAATLMVASLELAQVLVWSRYADVSDVISGGLGVLLGAAIAQSIASAEDRQRSGAIPLWPVAALAVWCVVLAVRHWAPFDFSIDPGFVKQRLPGLFQVPFRNYYAATPIDAGYEAMTKILLALPVGVLVQRLVGLRRWFASGVRGAAGASLVVAALSSPIFVVLEIGQVLVPSRYPDGTDVLLGALGAAIGALLAARVWASK